MFMTEDQFRVEQFGAYFSVSLWFFSAIVACDWVSLCRHNMGLPHCFTSNILLAIYSIHVDVLMRSATSGFDKWIFMLKSITSILYNAYNLSERLNHITIIVAILTVIHITHVYFLMNNMEADYQCQVDPLCTNGTHNSVVPMS